MCQQGVQLEEQRRCLVARGRAREHSLRVEGLRSRFRPFHKIALSSPSDTPARARSKVKSRWDAGAYFWTIHVDSTPADRGATRSTGTEINVGCDRLELDLHRELDLPRDIDQVRNRPKLWCPKRRIGGLELGRIEDVEKFHTELNLVRPEVA